MKKAFNSLFIFIIFYSQTSQAQNGDSINNYDSILLKTTLIPLVANSPTIETDTIISNPMDFYVIIYIDSIIINYSGLSNKVLLVEELDNYIINNNIAEVDSQKYLKISKDVPIERVTKVIDVFTHNKIDKFNLIAF
jgi:hypothetical protein